MLNELSIEIIKRCPNHCIYCSSLSTDKSEEIIPYDTFKEIIDDAVEFGLKIVCFSGGEPFLHPQLVDMMEYSHKKGLKNYIYTSGIYLSENGQKSSIPTEIINNIANTADKIILNIETSNEETYDRIMGTKGCFNLLKGSIKKIIESNIEIESHFVPMKINKNQIKETLKFCSELGISKISFLRLVIHGRAKENEALLSLSNDEVEEVKHLLSQIQYDNTYNIRIGVPFLNNNDKCRCEAAIGKINIKYNGLVYPCEAFKNTTACDGQQPDNIFNQRFASIYQHSPYLISIRENICEYHKQESQDSCYGQYYLSKFQKI